ncbi:DinB family protein [bacterium SCSIO 12741]|nr:DinB family protein [bacterium SCSIO 12741]
MTEAIQKQFELNRITRERALEAIEGLELEQLTRIPEGFNNSLLWNFGHIIVTQQLLSFGLCKQELPIEKELIERYRKGSAPDPNHPNAEADLNYFKANALKWIDLAREYYEEDRFEPFHSYRTSYGVPLLSLEDAIAFNNIHEGLHLGYMMAMKRAR